MKKIILLIAVALCTVFSSCNNEEPEKKDIVASIDADGMPHLFDEEQYTTQQIIDNLKTGSYSIMIRLYTFSIMTAL